MENTQPSSVTPETLPPVPTEPAGQQEPTALVPLWKNPRLIFAAAVAIIIIVAGVFFSSYSKGLKGSFDQFDAAVDYKISSFTVTQAADSSMELTYKIEKDAANLFMAITKTTAEDKPENDEMVKLIALADADLKAGEHKIQITAEDVKTSFTASGTYRFQIIAYNDKDEITDFKAEKRPITLESGKVKLAK